MKHMWMLTSFAESVLYLRMEYDQNKKWNLVQFYQPKIFELWFSTIVFAWVNYYLLSQFNYNAETIQYIFFTIIIRF